MGGLGLILLSLLVQFFGQLFFEFLILETEFFILLVGPREVFFDLGLGFLLFGHRIDLLLCEGLYPVFDALWLLGSLDHVKKSRFFKMLIVE